MSEVIIKPQHQSAPKSVHIAPPQSELRKAANRVVGVKYHNGMPVKELNVLTEKFDFGLSPAMLAEARDTRAGRFLLRILGCVDYAGYQNRPVMLVGRKIQGGEGGFRLTVVVPVDTRMKPGPVPMNGKNEHGVDRVG